MTNIRLNGVSFARIPHIAKNEPVVVVREVGEKWDSDAAPAYSVRLEGCHIGYIPLVTTLKEEALKARDGLKKVSKGKWLMVGKDQMRDTARAKMLEAENAEIVRDWIFVMMRQSHERPTGEAIPTYWDKTEGINYNEIGDICSISVRFDIA